MASSRRLSNGRSPLVNQQRQITSFFTPGKNSTQPSSISLPEPKKTPNPNFTPNPNQASTPSPQEKRKKPLLVIGPTLNRSSPSPNQTSTPSPQDAIFSSSSGKKSYSEEVVGKRIKVFWPLDESWYEGCVKSFDKTSGKHLVQYDDAEEEVLDLDKEKTEFLEDTAKTFRRLRRKSLICEIKSHEKENSDEESGRDDDSMDEDWGGNVKTAEDVDSEEVDLEDDEEELEQGKSKPTKVEYSGSGKRKALDGKISVSAKKSRVRVTGSAEKSFLNVSPNGNVGRLNDPPSSVEREATLNIFNNVVTGDAAERYSTREAEKFGFLGAKRRDANGRRPGDANYDPRTLNLPSDFLKSLTGGQRQWWEFKSKHMDKVLFFKMGKFYELFEMDAHIGAKELDLQYMRGEQPHCGFPEKNFAMNVEKLTKKGYRVLVVEQTETPEQLELRRKKMGSKDKVVKREICAVVTKGTLTEGEMLSVNPDAAYMISVTEKCQYSEDQENYTVIGVCVADVSTSRFMLGQFEDDSDRHCLCSILSELRPVEIIKPTNVLSAETEKVLMRHTRNPLVNDLIPCVEFWDAEKTVKEVKNIYKQFGDQLKASENDKSTGISADLRYLPDVLFKLVSEGDKGNLALAAFGGCLFYLRQAFLDETLLKFAKFESLPCTGFINALQKPYMSLDSSALENLEILENNSDGGISGTLFAQLDHCVTMFGKRLLKNWLARPLYHKKLIVERQDAIAGLKGLASALEFRKELSRLPDTERLLSRLFASCEANGRNANKVILYEDASKKQLQEFICALRGCQSMTRACSSLSSVLDTAESSLLNQLLTPGKGLPDVHSILKHFEDAFDWLEADLSGRIIPHEGVDTEYDFACTSVTKIESCLEKHLDEQRKLLRDRSIKFVTVGKESHLLEVPESLQGSVPRDYELRSSKKGFFRYWTPRIKELLAELSQTEGEKESKLKSILQRLIGLFCEHHIKWRQLVSTTAELDVLISLSIASDYYEGPTCRPAIRGTSCLMEVSPCFSAKNLGHLVLRSDGMGKGSFVPNDVTIGGAGRADFILLTGPNMGGKSTLLRQICLAVILAQVGADVPADSFELSLVDRIFVRMGARDHIMAGQSTFLTELSETAAMLSSATQNSLVALDELGRGTSTSDGQAIAQSVLEHFIRKVGCRGIFSTHYHRLAVDYEQDPKVALCHMACHVGKGVRGVEEVTFLYRLTPGACPKSYGVNVARLAGLPDSILYKAATKSIQFESNYGKHHHGVAHKSSSHTDEDESAVIRDILNFLVPTSCHEDSKAIGASELRELQQRARLLLRGN